MLTIEEIELLINRKGYESNFTNSNLLKVDVYYLGLKKQSELVNGGSYYCPECDSYHFAKDSKEMNNIVDKFKRLNNNEIFIW